MKAINIPSGTRYGKLTVVKTVPNIGRNKSFLVECDCGKLKVVQGRYLRHKKVTSCGCSKQAPMLDGHKKTMHPLYQTWKAIHFKTKNESHKGYAACGGMGIKVCERWDSFENFVADVGERPPNTILCRVDLAKDYEPNNVRWLTHVQKRALHYPKGTHAPTSVQVQDRAERQAA